MKGQKSKGYLSEGFLRYVKPYCLLVMIALLSCMVGCTERAGGILFPKEKYTLY